MWVHKGEGTGLRCRSVAPWFSSLSAKQRQRSRRGRKQEGFSCLWVWGFGVGRCLGFIWWLESFSPFFKVHRHTVRRGNGEGVVCSSDCWAYLCHLCISRHAGDFARDHAASKDRTPHPQHPTPAPHPRTFTLTFDRKHGFPYS